MMNPAVLGRLAVQHGLTVVERSDVDPTGFEVCWDGWPVFSKVTRKEAQLLRSLILIRLIKKYRKGQPKLTSSYFALNA